MKNILFSKIPRQYEKEFLENRIEENYRTLKFFPFLLILISILYLLQYRFFPGQENESEYFLIYIYLFIFAMTVSILFRLALPLVHKFLLNKIQEILYIIYYFLMFLFCICLTLLDLQISTDFSAYAVGLFSLAFFMRIDLWKYVSLVLAGLVLFLLAFIFGFEEASQFQYYLPIFAFSVLTIFIVYSREKTRIQLFLLRHQLQESSLRDPLTGLFNRRYLLEFLSSRISFFKRYGHSSTVLLFDIDHFKKVNDKLGHNIGDEVIKEFTLILNQNIRKTDLSCRYGGEEFILILTDTALHVGYDLAERIRKCIETHEFKDVSWTITSSIGLAEIQEGDNESILIERADKNLYNAKETGRNKAVI